MSQWQSNRPYGSRNSSYDDPSRSGSFNSSSGARRDQQAYDYNASAYTGAGHRQTQSSLAPGNVPSQGSFNRTASPSSGHRASASAATIMTPSQSSNGNGTPPAAPEQFVQQQQARPRQNDVHDMNRVVQLFATRKYYNQGYVMKAVDLGADGRPPSHGDPLAQWDEWFLQLMGSELSLWNVAAMNKADAAGTTVPPTYLKINDSFTTFVDLNPRRKDGGGPPQNHPLVFALNNAGSNRILFACSNETEHRKWLNAFRLAEWETGRLCEIYTGTLLGMQGKQFVERPRLVKGVMEGAVDVRLPGETEWSKAFLVLSDGDAKDKQKRRSSLMNSFSGFGSQSSRNLAKDAAGSGPSASHAAFYASKKSKKPFLIIHHLLSVYAVWPEAEKLALSSTIAKVEGAVEWDDTADMPKGFELNARRRDVRDGGRAGGQSALLFIPEDISRDGHQRMLDWIVGFCETFKHFGRGRVVGARTPYDFDFNPTSAASPYYAYPVGPGSADLFLHPLQAENLDIYERRPEQIRASFQDMLAQRMRKSKEPAPAPAGYLENGISQRSTPTSQPPKLDTIGESGQSRPNSLGTELDAAAAGPSSAPAQAPQPSPKPSLSINTGSNLVPAIPQQQQKSNAYPEASVFSPATDSQPASALSASVPASTAFAAAGPSHAGQRDIRRSMSERRSPVPSIPAQEVIQPTRPSAERNISVSDFPVVPQASAAPPQLPRAPESAALTSARAESMDTGLGSFESSAHRDMLAALDFIRSTPEPEQSTSAPAAAAAAAGPSRQLASSSSQPLSAQSASSYPTSGFTTSGHSLHVVEPSSPDEYAGSSDLSKPTKVPSYASTAPSSKAPSSSTHARRLEEQEASAKARADALHKPGRSAAPNGTFGVAKSTGRRVANFSSDEEAEEEDEDDSLDDRSPIVAPLNVPANKLGASTTSSISDAGRRNSRALPQIPAGPSRVSDASRNPPAASSRQTSPLVDQPPMHAPSASRSSFVPPPPSSPPDDGVPLQQQQRQSAFQPGGLLSTGLQHKQERSAKAMEANAREGGAPLLDMPAKAPEAQSGLISHVVASEKDRRREGGRGAAWTQESQAAQQHQQRMSMQGGSPNSPHMGGYSPAAYNPYGMGMHPGYGGMPFMQQPWMGMDPHAYQMAQMAAQQAFMSVMGSFQQQQQGMQSPPTSSQPSSPIVGQHAPFGGQPPFMPPTAMGTPGAGGPYGGFSAAPGQFGHHHHQSYSSFGGPQSMSGSVHHPPAAAGQAARRPSMSDSYVSQGAGTQREREARE